MVLFNYPASTPFYATNRFKLGYLCFCFCVLSLCLEFTTLFTTLCRLYNKFQNCTRNCQSLHIYTVVTELHFARIKFLYFEIIKLSYTNALRIRFFTISLGII